MDTGDPNRTLIDQTANSVDDPRGKVKAQLDRTKTQILDFKDQTLGFFVTEGIPGSRKP